MRLRRGERDRAAGRWLRGDVAASRRGRVSGCQFCDGNGDAVYFLGGKTASGVGGRKGTVLRFTTEYGAAWGGGQPRLRETHRLRPYLALRDLEGCL